MCGLAGIFSITDSKASYDANLNRMVCAVAHRGPDGEGAYADAANGIFLGHRRLSIIDLSDKAAQPMWDFEKRYVLIFNGEIYNYKELKSQITDYPFTTGSDSEVILASFRKWGADCVKKFNGIFTVAIWDTRAKSLFIARDQIGIKPLYYYTDDKVFVFASEIRSLLSSGLVPVQFNQQALGEYLTYQSTLRGNTLVKNVKRLLAGTYMVLIKNDVQTKTYWNIFESRHFEYSDELSVKKQVREKIFTAVRRQMVSDVPIGAFLSGGIDSSIMVAAMAMQSDQPINTFTVAFKEKEFDESELAAIIAKQYKTSHNEIYLSPEDILESIPGIVDVTDNPSGDGINSYIVTNAIKKAGLKVAISGLGGDELFAGYQYFKTYHKIISQNGLWSKTKILRKALSGALSTRKSSRIQKLSQLLKVKDPSAYNLYPILRAVYSQKEVQRLLGKDYQSGETLSDELYAADYSIAQYPSFAQFSIADMMGYTEGVLLKDSDQMSMANSVELRVPFFDVDLVEYVLGVPDKYKNPTRPKKLLVESMHNLIPDEISNKKKMGFTLPWDYWLKKELKPYVDEAFSKISNRGIVNGEVLSDQWHRFLKGDPTVTWTKIWSVVVLEHWMANVIDGTPDAT